MRKKYRYDLQKATILDTFDNATIDISDIPEYGEDLNRIMNKAFGAVEIKESKEYKPSNIYADAISAGVLERLKAIPENYLEKINITDEMLEIVREDVKALITFRRDASTFNSATSNMQAVATIAALAIANTLDA